MLTHVSKTHKLAWQRPTEGTSLWHAIHSSHLLLDQVCNTPFAKEVLIYLLHRVQRTPAVRRKTVLQRQVRADQAGAMDQEDCARVCSMKPRKHIQKGRTQFLKLNSIRSMHVCSRDSLWCN